MNHKFNTKKIQIVLLDITELRFRRNYYKIKRKFHSLKKIRKYLTLKLLEIAYSEPIEVTSIYPIIKDDKIPAIEINIEVDYDTKLTEPNHPTVLAIVEHLRTLNKFCAVDVHIITD